MIRAARPSEAAAISDLAIRSKAHWAYPAEQLAVFRRELTMAGGDLAARRAHVFEEGDRLVGFYTMVERSDDSVELEHLFVDPSDFGRGVGTALFEHACAAASAAGWTRLVILSDPNAQGFYRALGARLEAYVASSIPGRELPLFALELERPNMKETPR